MSPSRICLRQDVNKNELTLTSPVTIDGHVKSQIPVTEEHRLLCVPSNISQVPRMLKGDCPKPDDENMPTLVSFVGHRL
ncbi:hypothetical protein CEXT_603161 [Caerostris extrusa]|uniref:Uncharacterized protein n=1 Tax=Caerostris extrusa TaxID=172846 RepID=A0AAV4SPZ2_CAEEX|nr:hypothetical protein CEXT_603161 [Caerostris extrusa]